ncbi:MAG: TlpA family protein disulfide reductase [Verrucomicrobia bacterium]|nr:TlpA family protein disulfide reductase [Verrucomicrobiota bacterium]
MNPRRTWLGLFRAMLLTSALAGLALGAEPTAGGVAGVFEPGDSEATAFGKIRTFSGSVGMTATSDAMVRLQLACRDFCRRFPDGKNYFEVRRIAVIWWTGYTWPRTNRESLPLILGRLKSEGWDPTDAERDPRLNAEQRATIAVQLTNSRTSQSRFFPKTDAELRFERIVAALPQHQATQMARDALVDAALRLPAERKAYAIATLRRHYPADAEAAKAIALLEQLGQPFELRFTAMDGRVVDLRDYRGRAVLLEFWSKTCAGCIASIPDLKALDTRFGPRGFAIIGVSLDTNRADAEEVVKKHAVPWPQYFDGKGSQAELAERLLVHSIPRGILIDAEGRLRSLHCGAHGDDNLKQIERALPGRRVTQTEVSNL